MTDVTRILQLIETGDAHASDELPLVYDELRRLAAHELGSEPAGHTLQPTALVHEAYVRLVDQQDKPRWNHRGHFYAAAAEAMRLSFRVRFLYTAPKWRSGLHAV